jgi:AcrR family transcriptional regulator
LKREVLVGQSYSDLHLRSLLSYTLSASHLPAIDNLDNNVICSIGRVVNKYGGGQMPKKPIEKRVRRDPKLSREEILSAAERLMTEKGPDAVGLKDVAKEAGVSHALVSHYFGTYESLVEEVLSLGLVSLSNAVLAKMNEEGLPKTPGELLERLFSVIDTPGYVRLTTWALLSGRLQDPKAFPARLGILRTFADAVHSRLTQLFTAFSLPAPRIEDTEHSILVAVVAAYGYSLGKAALLPALGREVSSQSDAWFREKLGEMIRARLAPPGWLS